MFSLDDTEMIIQEFPCYIKRIVKEHGRLYISSNYLCFNARVFGKQTRIVISIKDLVALKIESRNSISLKTRKKKFVFNEIADPAVFCDILTRLQQKSVASKSSLAQRDPVLSSSRRMLATGTNVTKRQVR